MSQYLTFTAKKDNQDVCTLLYYCTSIARGLSSENIFPYTQDEVVLTIDSLKNYIEELKKEFIDSNKSYIKKDEKLLVEYRNITVTTKEAMEYKIELINDTLSSIETSKEELNMWTRIQHELEFILKFMEENNELEVTYINC